MASVMHDFDQVSCYCRRCGISAVEFMSSDKKECDITNIPEGGVQIRVIERAGEVSRERIFTARRMLPSYEIAAILATLEFSDDPVVKSPPQRIIHLPEE